MDDEEILRRFELGFFTEWGVCFQSPGDARAEVFDEAEFIDNEVSAHYREWRHRILERDASFLVRICLFLVPKTKIYIYFDR